MLQKFRIDRVDEKGLNLLDLKNNKVYLDFDENVFFNEFKKNEYVELFAEKDDSGKLIFSFEETEIFPGAIVYLKAINVIKQGAFFATKTGKDIFMPESEFRYDIQPNKRYLVSIHTNEPDKMFASCRIYPFLEECGADSDIKEREIVVGTIYNINDEIGAFVAVKNRFKGLIPKNEYYKRLNIGDIINVRVVKIREDGKIDLSLRKESYIQIDEDAQIILDKLKIQSGFLYLNDKSSPRDIMAILKLSKKAFKRAVGKLFKNHLITLENEGIRLVEIDEK